MKAIDVHAHFVPPRIIETLHDKGREFGVGLVEAPPGCWCARFDHGPQIRPFFPGLTDIDMRRRDMARQGVDRQVLSLWTDIFGYGQPAAQGVRWHRLMNDCLAGLAADEPERFSWLASGPLQAPAEAARELERAMLEDGAVGAIVAANVEGTNLGEAGLDEFWAAAEQLRAPVFIHPALPQAPDRAKRFGLNQIVAYTNDTTLAVGSLIFDGVLDRHPGLELILSHGGGALPWLLGRFDRVHHAMDHAATGNRAALPPSAYMTRFHYDTILHDAAALRFLADRVGIGRLLLGSDVPFPPGDPDPLAVVRAAFDEAGVRRVAEMNPKALFRLG